MYSLLYEGKLFEQGLKTVAGVDEVGRGPLAGPVVAATVMIKAGQKIDTKLLREVKDSKKLSEKKREELSKIIIDKLQYVSIAMCDNKTIDKINILQASLLAMKQATTGLASRPELLLIDGNFAIKNYIGAQKTVIKGDSRVFCIAAASIIAKVKRDAIMRELHETYPNYSFDKHKGYGTKLHLERLQLFGVSPVHRRSFAPVKNALTQMT